MFGIIQKGLFQEVGPPRYGRQDLGISPAGCMDRFAFDTGNIMLDNPPDHPALEIIFGPQLVFESAAYFILTGAMHHPVTLTVNDRETDVSHARVYLAQKGSTLTFGEKVYGFRSYLCWREAILEKAGGKASIPDHLIGRERGPFEDLCDWVDPGGLIRVVEGPEYGLLSNPRTFTSQAWSIAADSNQMGLRLLHTTAPLDIRPVNMISAPVSDGTVQMAPKGPIVLLRHRQTIGGYPRVYNVISGDVDMLAQYMPGQRMRFKVVTMQEALEIAGQRQNSLQVLKNRFAA